MKKFRLIIAHLIILTFCLSACKAQQEAAISPPTSSQNTVTVVVQPVQRDTVTRKIFTKGTLQADEKAMISPKVSGKIMEIKVEEGYRVQKGQLLVRMDDTELQLDLKRAEATIEELKARLEAAKTEVDNAQARLTAMEASVNRSQADYNLKVLEKERTERLVLNQSLPQQKLDYAKSALDMASASLEASRAELESGRSGLRAAEAGLKTSQASLGSGEKSLAIARERLQDTRITAPISGTITKKIMNLGDVVDSGKTILVLEKTDSLELRAKVSSEYLQEMKAGQEMILYPDGILTPIKTSLSRINPAIDPLDRSIEIVSEIPNPDNLLKPGLFAKVEIITEILKEVVVVPSTSIVERNNQRVVFIAENNQAKMRQVVLGFEAEDRNVILEGLKGDELLVIEGQNELAGDEFLKIKKRG